MSTGEAEFHAATKAAAEALAVQAYLRDLGWDTQIRLEVDASAAKAMASRQGLGKVRHLQVRFLWLQDMVQGGVIRIQKVRGKLNPADVLTKSLPQAVMASLLGLVGIT